MAPNNRAPSQLVPSEMVIVTRGALQRHSGKGPLSHCAHYFYNRMCNRGDRCGFLHCAFIDENASDFQRAPPRAGASNSTAQPHAHKAATAAAPAAPAMHHQPAAAAPLVHHVPTLKTCSSVHSGASSCDLSESPRSQATDSPAPSADGLARSPSNASVTSTVTRAYRHNPYSLIETTLAMTL
eukprot:115129_1